MAKDPARPTAREAKRLATRERVYSAAVDEFTRTGLADADVSAIVEAAGVAHGTFFFHFPTKEHVVAELGQREEVRMAGQLDRFLTERRDLGDTLAEVVRLSLALEKRLGTVLFKDVLALYFSPSRPELDLWTDHPVIQRVIDEFGRVPAPRDAGDVDPANRAMFFLLGLYGLLITYDRQPARRGVLDQFVSTVLASLGLRSVAPGDRR